MVLNWVALAVEMAMVGMKGKFEEVFYLWDGVLYMIWRHYFFYLR